MKKTISTSVADFKALIENDCYYVDKTQAIEELLTKQKIGTVLFPRPRRFGKSLFLSMLENFFDIEKREENKNLFKGLYISKSKVYKENLNKYPVIHLDFKSLNSENFDNCYDKIKTLISNLYKTKKYIKEVLDKDENKLWQRLESEKGTQKDYEYSISNLCLWLERYYNEKVIVLIDEYDVPMNSGYNNRYYEKIMGVIQPMFSNAFKGNNSLKLGILTGVLRIGGESLFSDFNNPDIYDIMSKGYNEYFGFTKNETKELLKYYDMKYTETVREYYDGYNFSGTHIYNPWSILNYTKNKKLETYWCNTASNTLIRHLLSELSEQDKFEIEHLLLGQSINFDYDPKLSYRRVTPGNFIATLNLLLISGYLTLDYQDDNGITYFRIPNQEVRKDLCNTIEEIMFGEVIYSRRETQEFIKSLLENNTELATDILNNLIKSASYQVSKESFYQGYVLSVFDNFLNQNLFITRVEEESGYGRSDILVKKKDKSLGLIIEVKRAKSLKEMEKEAKQGLEQIKNKNYKMDMERDDVKVIHEYSIVFYGRKAIIM